jgi:FcoT-like thioesterase domain
MSALAKLEPDAVVSAAAPAQQGTITAGFIAEVLQPYRANAKYLHAAELTYVRSDAAANDEASLVVGRGHFTIPASCYIDDTGHFNAVEFNICYNQLGDAEAFQATRGR